MALDLRQHEATASSTKKASAGAALFAPQVTDTDRLFFTEQLALLLETGVNLHAALEALRDQVSGPALAALLAALAEEVAQGKPFSDALSKHPEVFSTTYVNLIAAAENGGFLHEVLGQLLEMEEKRAQLRSTLMSALSYPLFLAFFSTAVVAFVLVVVFPKFGKLFVSIQDQLPPSTLFLMWVSDTLRHNWAVVLGAATATVLLVRRLLGSAAGRARVDHFKLNAPLLRDIFVPVYLVQVLRTMGLSLGNGVSLVDTLRGCRDIVANESVRRFLTVVEGRVREGANFSTAFAEGRFLPPLVKRMVTTGDETGNLARVLGRVADHYERELGKRLQKVSKIAEPLMLLIMGGVVGILVSSLILPIFKLTRAVG